MNTRFFDQKLRFTASPLTETPKQMMLLLVSCSGF